MDNEERIYVEELKQAHRRRLRVLEVKAAEFGMNCPPEVQTEINEIKRKLGGLDEPNREGSSDSKDLIHSLSFSPKPIIMPQWLIQIGEVNIPSKDPHRSELYKNIPNGGSIRTLTIPITFDYPFTKYPRVIVSLKKLDLGDRIIRVEVIAENIRLTGFELCFKTWLDSKIYDAAASWIAIGE